MGRFLAAQNLGPAEFLSVDEAAGADVRPAKALEDFGSAKQAESGLEVPQGGARFREAAALLTLHQLVNRSVPYWSAPVWVGDSGRSSRGQIRPAKR